jgi:uncharacterized membrane protein YbaN (DUF454 family)
MLSLLGFTSLGFGIAGFFLPVWPSTVFFIVAAALFAKSNPKMERWLMEHPRVGPSLRAWREEKAIARSAKIAATLAIIISFGISIFFANLLWLQAGLFALGAALVVFICTRPEPAVKCANSVESAQGISSGS